MVMATGMHTRAEVNLVILSLNSMGEHSCEEGAGTNSNRKPVYDVCPFNTIYFI